MINGNPLTLSEVSGGDFMGIYYPHETFDQKLRELCAPLPLRFQGDEGARCVIKFNLPAADYPIYTWSGTIADAVALRFQKDISDDVLRDAAEGTMEGSLLPSNDLAGYRQAIKNGNPAGRELMASILNEIALSLDLSLPQKHVLDVAGDEPDIAAFCMGIPEHMVRWEDDAVPCVKHHEFLVLQSYPWWTSAMHLAVLGGLFASVVDVLEANAVRCQVDSLNFAGSAKSGERVFYGHDDNGREAVYSNFMEYSGKKGQLRAFEIRVKHYEDRLAMHDLAFWCIHPFVLRAFGFLLCQHTHDLRTQPVGSGSYGKAIPSGVTDDYFTHWPQVESPTIIGDYFRLDGGQAERAEMFLSLIYKLTAVIASHCGGHLAAHWCASIAECIRRNVEKKDSWLHEWSKSPAAWYELCNLGAQFNPLVAELRAIAGRRGLELEHLDGLLMAFEEWISDRC